VGYLEDGRPRVILDLRRTHPESIDSNKNYVMNNLKVMDFKFIFK